MRAFKSGFKPKNLFNKVEECEFTGVSSLNVFFKNLRCPSDKHLLEFFSTNFSEKLSV